jgi:two-component system LytT family response regulator
LKLKNYPLVEDIVYLKADSNYTLFYLQTGQVFIASKTLKQTHLEHQFSLFLRVHKSYLLNPDFIDSISKESNKITIILKNGTKINVSRRKAIALQEYLKKFFTA